MTTNRQLVIVGGGALGREVHQYALDMVAANREIRQFERVAGFLDDSDAVPGRLQDHGVDFDFVDRIDDHIPRDEFVYIVAIGSATERYSILNRLEGIARWATIVHPTSYLAPSATLGKGVILAPFSFVGANASLDDHTVLNTYASCGHDSRVGACSVLSPYAVINGDVELGEEVFMGTHATVIPGLKVGRRSSLSAGSVIVRNVDPGFFMIGNPAKGWRMYGD